MKQHYIIIIISFLILAIIGKIFYNKEKFVTITKENCNQIICNSDNNNRNSGDHCYYYYNDFINWTDKTGKDCQDWIKNNIKNKKNKDKFYSGECLPPSTTTTPIYKQLKPLQPLSSPILPSVGYYTIRNNFSYKQIIQKQYLAIKSTGKRANNANPVGPSPLSPLSELQWTGPTNDYRYDPDTYEPSLQNICDNVIQNRQCIWEIGKTKNITNKTAYYSIKNVLDEHLLFYDTSLGNDLLNKSEIRVNKKARGVVATGIQINWELEYRPLNNGYTIKIYPYQNIVVNIGSGKNYATNTPVRRGGILPKKLYLIIGDRGHLEMSEKIPLNIAQAIWTIRPVKLPQNKLLPERGILGGGSGQYTKVDLGSATGCRTIANTNLTEEAPQKSCHDFCIKSCAYKYNAKHANSNGFQCYCTNDKNLVEGFDTEESNYSPKKKEWKIYEIIKPLQSPATTKFSSSLPSSKLPLCNISTDLKNRIGDGICDDKYNTKDCNWDGGDCCGESKRGKITQYKYCDINSGCKCLDPSSSHYGGSLGNSANENPVIWQTETSGSVQFVTDPPQKTQTPLPFESQGWYLIGNIYQDCKSNLLCGTKQKPITKNDIPKCDQSHDRKIIQDRRYDDGSGCVMQGCPGNNPSSSTNPKGNAELPGPVYSCIAPTTTPIPTTTKPPNYDCKGYFKPATCQSDCKPRQFIHTQTRGLGGKFCKYRDLQSVPCKAGEGECIKGTPPTTTWNARTAGFHVVTTQAPKGCHLKPDVQPQSWIDCSTDSLPWKEICEENSSCYWSDGPTTT